MTEPTDLEYTPVLAPVPAMVRREEVDAMRADVDLLCGYLRAVLDGMTVQELCQLADVVEEVEARWGLVEGEVES